MGPAQRLQQREVRVFISSTFRDMQEEREELVKQAFPQLRRLCESRGVTWGEVDLRWGVTDEAKAEGKVLPLCLAEIERCRPYFIGLLGERYGWVPEEIPPDLLEAQPWLTEYRKESVTALEILHGVLRNPRMAGHAFFYFRDPNCAAGRQGFTEEDAGRRAQLVELKETIRKSGFPVGENFDKPKMLGEWVVRDLTRVIDTLYPESSTPNPLDRAAADNEAYAASRRRVYIGRPEYMEWLDAHAAGEGQPFVVTGESGGGKSALLANWAARWRAQHAETPVITHFIGAAPDSADWMAMLRRLLAEFQRLGAEFEIPNQPDALRKTFANALHMIAARGRLVIVLDALNQIEDRDGAPDLVWLPPVIPANVRLIVSTLPGRSWESLCKRAWPVLAVEPLTAGERERLIEVYLRQFAKQLDARRRHRIAAAPQAANSLYLTTLLNELRLFGSHDELDERITWYLEASGPVDLYRKVIERWEQDYGQTGSIVSESLSRIWAARRGLSEAELLESLGKDGSRLPRSVWSPLFLAASDALVNRGGLLTFAHDFLREAVRDVYLSTSDIQRSAHRTIAEYFQSQPESPRRLDELPWQRQEAAEWDHLADLLAASESFDALWIRDQFEVKAYWTRIEAHSSRRMEQLYESVIAVPSRDANQAWRVGLLLADTGKSEAALRLRAGLAQYYRARGDRANMQRALGGQAVLLKARGDLDGAMALHREQEQICREFDNKDGLQRSLGNQALILKARGDLDGAMALHKEQEQLCRELGNKFGLLVSVANQALVLHARGDLDGAMALYREQERMCREQGNRAGLEGSLGNQALVVKARGDMDGAMALLKEQERLCRELGYKVGLQSSLTNQALILQARDDPHGALKLLEEQQRLCEELRDPHGLSISLANQAFTLSGVLGRRAEARRLAAEALNIAERHGYKLLIPGMQRIRDAIPEEAEQQ